MAHSTPTLLASSSSSTSIPRPMQSFASASPSASRSVAPSSPSVSIPNATPLLSIPASGTGLTGLRLLMPTVRVPRTANSTPATPISPPKSPRSKAASTKLIRSRSASISANAYASPDLMPAPRDPAMVWFGTSCKLDIVQEQLEVEGYQLYAVEKWVTRRTKPVVTLAVFTGDVSHKITVTAFSPGAYLNEREAQAEWNKAIRDLRQAGARPMDTGKGILMVTSLATFRSDYTIVHIPSGQFLEARDRLYTNINLLRMGCSGRSALTLEEPSDTTKDRFIGMYHVQDKVRTTELFSATTLELVRLIQASLSIFGKFDLSPEEQNGLLCDVTEEGLQDWISEIGEPILNVEPMERIPDPPTVSALLSLVVCVRLKLYALGFNQSLPKDPFVEPNVFVQGIQTFCTARMPYNCPNATKPQFLTLEVIQAIDAAYEKLRQSESYKVHRVLLNKLDDLTTDLRTSSVTGSAAQIVEPTTDLALLVKIVVAHGREGTASLRYFWTGRPTQLARKRRERFGFAGSDGEREDERTDGRSTEDETDLRGWGGGRVRRKIGSWAGLHRSKKQSADFSAKSGRSGGLFDLPSGHLRSPSVPQVVVSPEQGDEEDILSSGQTSPNFQPHLFLSPSYLVETDSAAVEAQHNLSERVRRLHEFDQRRPRTRPVHQNRITSWADPMSGERLGEASARASRDDLSKDDSSIDERARREYLPSLTRRRSFDDASRMRRMRVLPLERMKIDVDLCGQLLIMRRREKHLDGVVSCLQVLTNVLAGTNARLREDYEGHQQALADADARTKVIADIEAMSAKADTMMQQTRAMCYESEQFRWEGLWHNVSPQRHKVLAMRDKVFGQGRRSGVPGRFNYVQWTLDGNERLVDRLGRTPEEAAEERGMPEVMVEEEDDEIVESQVMKPTWLLKFFESWGTRWRVSGGGGKVEEKPKVEGKAKPPEQKRKVQWMESPERATSASPPHLSLNDSD